MTERDRYMLVVLILVAPHINILVAALCSIIFALHFYFNTEDESKQLLAALREFREHKKVKQTQQKHQHIEFDNSDWPEADVVKKP